jgi:penicillin-binding protein 1A
VRQEPKIPVTLLAEAGATSQSPHGALVRRLSVPRSRSARWLTAAWWRPAACFLVTLVALLLLPVMGLAYHVFFDRRGLPDIEPFIRFTPPTIGEVYDARGTVLIRLAREYRRVVSYDEIPPVLRHAILSAEDKNFFTHAGVDYRALPRVLQKGAARSLAGWGTGDAGFRMLLGQGGSTLTQQLVRGYFLQHLTSREGANVLLRDGLTPRLLSAALGISATNKLLRKLEEVRLALWLEAEMRRHYGSQVSAKREIFARYASFIYLGNGRYGFAAGSEYYFGKPLSSYGPEDAGKAALLAGIMKSPRDYAPVPGDPRPLRRRNQILALMARNGYLSEALATRGQAEPIRITARSAVKTNAPAAIEHVFDELKHHGRGRFGVEDLVQGRISVHATVDERIQSLVNLALETGLARYEQRHPEAKGLIQGSVVVLRNADGAILAEAGGRQVYQDRYTRYSDYNRVTDSRRQAGSAFKPLLYLAAFRRGLDLDTTVPDEPISVPLDASGSVKWITNYDHQFKGPIPLRQALAESSNAVAVWLAQEIGVEGMIRTARELGIRTPLQPYISTALGASEVELLELASVYRAIASGILAEPHIIERVHDASGGLLYEAPRRIREIDAADLALIQEGLRGVIRLPSGTAHALDGRDFPIPVLGKTGTTSDFRDALFVGSTYGRTGITVAVRIGFDDNRGLGDQETGGRAALPIFREIMRRVYRDELVGPVPEFPPAIEGGIEAYLARRAPPEVGREEPPRPAFDVGLIALPSAAPQVTFTDGLPPSRLRGPRVIAQSPGAIALQCGPWLEVDASPASGV